MSQGHLRAICLCLTVIALILSDAPGQAAGADEAPVALFVFNRPPYYRLEPGKPPGGFLLEMALDIFQMAGIPVTLQEMPHSRTQALFEARDIRACAVGWIHLPSRESFAWFSRPFYTTTPLGVVVRPSTAHSLGSAPLLEDLLAADLGWGLRQDFSHGQSFDAAFRAQPRLRITHSNDLRTILRLIARGRLDATLLSEEEFSAQLAAEPQLAASLQLLSIADGPPGFTRHIMCDKSVDPELLQRIDEAVTAYRRTDRYRQRLREGRPDAKPPGR